MTLTPAEKTELFGDFDVDGHAEEAASRWSGSPAWTESQRRTSSYGKQEWKRCFAESADISGRLAALMTSGVAASSAEAMDLAEEHRRHISRWFYDCTREIHQGLGELYVSDARFTDSIDRAAPGLAGYLRDAIQANAARSL
ncbi:TipAS antibiotic-recognition domain-containing protein [Nonomuraea sp. NPDC003804]|uniref:TipAS antibiotic-recognition domain-containing protein n=1 Tax=Nonomuraea sp. NPDC003804 TaxID=3154547 RepID=UPI00339E276D